MRNLSLSIMLVMASLSVYGQSETDFIVVDQFGYLPESQKIAVIRDPQTGFDAGESFSPGGEYALVNVMTEEQVFTANPEAWKSGQTDVSSGDKAWWFDFSSVTTSGKYYVLDIENNVRSFEFEISPSVYNEVLRQAVRTFFYQRVGHKKDAQYAGQEWADGASHIGPLQDKNARLFSSPNNSSTEKDVSGGWYDAGDYNKYTNWTANYVVEMMKAYQEAPGAWGDDYNIPESGNGVPDLLDEAKWGIDHLLRMQNDDGSVLSIVDEDHASPPSSATGPSLYGPASTSATLNAAAAFSISSKVFASISMTEYADQLRQQAIEAWEWADANPDVLFRNNDADYNSSGIGAGQQEESDYQRGMSKLEAACFLFDLTRDDVYQTYFDQNYTTAHLFEYNNFAYPFETANQEALLYYTRIPEATASVVNDIKSAYETGMKSGSENFPAWEDAKDPYMAHLKDYTWGSNSVKSLQGSMYYDFIYFELDPAKDQEAETAALAYINYIHGANPLNMTYLSNMYEYGAEKSVNEFYHTWFHNGSAKWDRVGESTYGPAPGFLTGGPNPSYSWDGCCPDDCGGDNNAICVSESIEPPTNQPAQKSYKDFNTSWPLNSWSVTENSCGYQINYIRLLSKFVDASYDCNGVKDGAAFYDACGQCAGGDTGVDPVTDPDECSTAVTGLESSAAKFAIYPNPGGNRLFLKSDTNDSVIIKITDVTGKLFIKDQLKTNTYIDINDLPGGSYFLIIRNLDQEVIVREKFIKE